MKIILVVLAAIAIIIVPHAWHCLVFDTSWRVFLFLDGISFVQFVFACLWCNYISAEL